MHHSDFILICFVPYGGQRFYFFFSFGGGGGGRRGGKGAASPLDLLSRWGQIKSFDGFVFFRLSYFWL